MASENELLVSFSPIESIPKVDDLSDTGYEIPAIFRIVYRTRVLQCFNFEEELEYSFFARRK